MKYFAEYQILEKVNNTEREFDTCNVTGYNNDMIKSFAHKGLKDFYETGSKKGIQPDHAPKLARMTFYFEGQDAFLVDYMDYH